MGRLLAGVGPVQEAAAAVLLHHLGPREARQFAEAVRAVDDRVAAVALGVTQQEITVCEGDMERCQKEWRITEAEKKAGGDEVQGQRETSFSSFLLQMS